MGVLLLKIDIVENARTISRGEGEGQRRKEQGDLGQASDQILGNNNIRNGPFDMMFHARPAARNIDTLPCPHMNSHSQ